MLLLNALAASGHATEVGPERGTLFIVGGWIKSDEIYERFFELAGGKDASIVVVPTAGGGLRYDDSAGDFLKDKGATRVQVFHTLDREKANDEAFCAILEKARAIWFKGGRQWRLVDAYQGTLAEKKFRQVLNRDGVIGGSSAGATIMGSYLVRGDTRSNQIMMGDHEKGFGYLRNTAIDQHVIARNRHFDLFQILKQKRALLGIAIDEDTAIEVNGDQFVVFGSHYVLVYDGKFYSSEGFDQKVLPPPAERFYFLKPGDRYDMAKREVLPKPK